MTLDKRKNSFIQLGSFLRKFVTNREALSESEQKQAQKLDQTIETSIIHNAWFSKEDIYFNLKQWVQNLTSENINQWLSKYDIPEGTPKTVAVIMAGNVPLVGFHDFLCVLLSGHKILIKQSSKDKHLLPYLADFLISQDEEFKALIEFTHEKLENYDAVIATGSNNTARYFEYYFAKKPHIIRKNRNSVALISGNETKDELKKLGEDIFRYYGLGCRNVSKIFVPKDYDFKNFYEAIFDWNPIINHHKYANNYDYNKAVYLMSEFKIYDNGFLTLKEEKSYASPIACLFYEFYEDKESLKQQLKADKEKIQCILSEKASDGELKFGQSQMPKFSDYADNVDTMTFLTKIKSLNL